MTFLTWPLAAIAGRPSPVPLLVLLYFKTQACGHGSLDDAVVEKSDQDLQTNAPFRNSAATSLVCGCRCWPRPLLASPQPELLRPRDHDQPLSSSSTAPASMSSSTANWGGRAPSRRSRCNNASASSPASFVPRTRRQRDQPPLTRAKGPWHPSTPSRPGSSDTAGAARR